MQRMLFIGIMAAAGLIFLVCGCRSSRDEEEKLIQMQIQLLEKQVKALEGHQESMKKSLKAIQLELNQMENEINRLEPRIYVTRSAVSTLRDLTSGRDRESDLSWIMRNLSVSTRVLLWVLVLWLLYRLHKQGQKKEARAELARDVQRQNQPGTPQVAPQAPAPPTSSAQMEPPPSKPAEKKAPGTRAKERNKTRNKGCKVKGCPNKHRSKGFCNKHYQQWRRGTLTEPIGD
jgi:outer membrane murein-binding lipoprotein Lpp